MQFVISHDIKPNISTTTDKNIIVFLYESSLGSAEGERREKQWVKATQSAPVLVEEGEDLSENTIMSHTITDV
jgi:hypothetical protein